MLITPISVIQSDTRNLFCSSHIFQGCSPAQCFYQLRSLSQRFFLWPELAHGETCIIGEFCIWIDFTELSLKTSLYCDKSREEVFSPRNGVLPWETNYCSHYWLYWPLIQHLCYSATYEWVHDQCSILLV